jgi:hypothetical protein
MRKYQLSEIKVQYWRVNTPDIKINERIGNGIAPEWLMETSGCLMNGMQEKASKEAGGCRYQEEENCFTS